MEVFKTLSTIDVSKHTEKKGKFSYLSWAWAWSVLKENYPCSTAKVYEREDGRIYWDDGRTAWVKVGVTINNLEHVEYFPIMDYQNKSMTIDKITSFNVNTSIQRGMTKAISRHGLGLYIYAGEDLPPSVIDKVRDLFIDLDKKDPDKLADFLSSKGWNPVDFKNYDDEKLEEVYTALNNLG
jgi:hypothetical protein